MPNYNQDLQNNNTTIEGIQNLANNLPEVYDWALQPNKPTYTAADVKALPISGGTLTGNLTGEYLTGTWLQTTSATIKNDCPYIGVIDASGWFYKIDINTFLKKSVYDTNNNGKVDVAESLLLSNNQYGTELPSTGVLGQVFFKKV